MGKWKMVQLGDVCLKTDNENPTRYDSEIIYIDISSVDSDSKKITSYNMISSKDAPSRARQKVFQGDILVSTVRPNLNAVAIVECEADAIIASTGFCVLRPNSARIYNRYLFEFVKSPTFILSMARQATGASYPAVSNKIVLDEKIPLPPLPVQRKIADVLDRASALIEKRKEQIEKLDLLIKSQFVEMFGDPVTNPKGWETKSLNSICNGIGDGLHGTPNYQQDGEISFINGNNLIDGKIVITPSTKAVGAGEYGKHYIDINDNAILVSINGTLGKLAFYNGEKVVFGKSACYCNLKSSINKGFIYGLMKSDGFQRFLENSSTKSTIKNVGLKVMRGFQVIQPPEELQSKFSCFAQQVEDQKSLLKQSLEKLELNYKSLMQKCFRGEIF